MSYFVIKTREKTRTDNGSEFLYNRNLAKMAEVISYFSKKIIANENLIHAPPGLYTWIFRKSGNLYAIKTITKQELGTLHTNIDMYTALMGDTTEIIAAGELEVVRERGTGPPTILFNLLSGSYMVKILAPLSAANKINKRNELVSIIEHILGKFKIASQFLDCSTAGCSDEEKIGGMKLIETANIRTGSSNLGELNKLFIRKAGGSKKTRKHSHRRRRDRRHYKKTHKA